MDALELLIRAFALVAPPIAVSVLLSPVLGQTVSFILGMVIGVFLNLVGERWVTPGGRRLRDRLSRAEADLIRTETDIARSNSHVGDREGERRAHQRDRTQARRS